MRKPVLLMVGMLMWGCLSQDLVGGHVLPGSDVNYSKDDFEKLTALVKDFRKENDNTKSTLSAVVDKLETQTAIVQTLQGQKLQQDALIESLQLEVAALKEQCLASDSRHDETAVQYAFSAVSYQDFGPVTEDTTVPFEVVYVNIGGNYSPTTNAFYASVAGVYYFTASAHVTNTMPNGAKVHILHTYGEQEQKRLVTLYSHGQEGSDSVSASVLVQLSQGDVVTVQLQQDTSALYSREFFDTFSSFSGFLLFST